MQSQILPLSRAVVRRHLALAALFATLSILVMHSAPAQAQTFTPLYSFPGGVNGGSSAGSLILGPVGSLIGTAVNSSCPCYMTFALSSAEEEAVLHRFNEPQGDEAEAPTGYVLNNSGNVLYGETPYGGLHTSSCDIGFEQIGCGIVFALDGTTKQAKLLHAFTNTPDGANPAGTLTLDSSGNLYGLTFGGGSNRAGTLFKITPQGKESILYSFGTTSTDGANPGWGPIINPAGNLLGVTLFGGTGTCSDIPPLGCGTVFEITPEGNESVLYNFTGGTDGIYPYDVTGDASGNLYGLSRNADNQVIAVFEVNAKGEFSIFYNGSFVSEITWIFAGPDGSLYGMANGGNPSCTSNGCGQIFQLTSTGGGGGNVTILHMFQDASDGALPNSLVVGNGVLYGSTTLGGMTNNGVVYKLVP